MVPLDYQTRKLHENKTKIQGRLLHIANSIFRCVLLPMDLLSRDILQGNILCG